MENMGELADQQMGGGSRGCGGTQTHSTNSNDDNDSTGVPTVDNVEAVESVDSVGSGVEPPELLPAHEIASEIAANRPESTDGDVDEVDDEVDNCDADDTDVSDVVTVPVTTGMIDATDFRGVLSEPTYQTLNGRMTPPGFTTSSSYATLTPLQPLPPISTMSDKFTHHYGHPGNGGFALMHMQNATLGMNTNQYQYDKSIVGTAMAAAGMNIQNMSPTLGVTTGHHHHHHHHHVSSAIINTNGGIHSHSSGIPSPPYPSNGLHSPDKSLSPTNGYDYTLRQGSPQSPSSVNLHSPTSLMPALNGLPTSPPSSHIPSPPPTQVSSMSSVPITVSGVLTSGTASVTAPQQTISHGQHLKVATTLTAAPQPITVLQAVTPTPAAIAPTAQTVTIVQAATAGISNLATTIVSTPVAVVTSANALHQQHQQLNQIKQQQQQIISIGGANSSKQANNQTVSQNSSSASNNGADDIEEINTKDLAQRISAELKRYSIPQAIFAQRVLCRSQGTLSDLLRNPKPWSKLKSGRETFRRMQKWLEEPEFQRMSALRLAEKEMRASAGTANGTELRDKLQMSEPHKQFNSFDGIKESAVVVRDKRTQRGQQLFHYQYEPYRSNYYGPGAAQEQPFIGEYSSSEWIPTTQTSIAIACKRKEEQQSVAKSPTAPKKPRLVFTDLQRRTLQAIFKETKRPSKEMQITISQQLGLELSTVGNFFMNARRRSQDKWLDDVMDTGSMSPASTTSSSHKGMGSSHKANVTAQQTSVLTIGNAAIVTCT